jgi:hypothetical protein
MKWKNAMKNEKTKKRKNEKKKKRKNEKKKKRKNDNILYGIQLALKHLCRLLGVTEFLSADIYPNNPSETPNPSHDASAIII